jgi:HMG (high mobility group) box
MEFEQSNVKSSQAPAEMSQDSKIPSRVPFGSTGIPDTTMGEDPKTSLLKKKYTRNPFKWVSHRNTNDAPKRPMSSYNMFFLLERERIVRGEPERSYRPDDVQQIVELQKIKDLHPKRSHRKSHGIISFHDLSRVVARRWKTLDEAAKEIFHQQANIEKMAYKKAMDEWVLTKMRGVSSSQPHSTDESSRKIRSTAPMLGPSTKIPMPQHHGMQVHRFFQRCVSSEGMNSSGERPSGSLEPPLEAVNQTTHPWRRLAMDPAPHHSLELTPGIALHHVVTHDDEWPRIGAGPLWYDPAITCSAELLDHSGRPRVCLQCGRPDVAPPDFYCEPCLGAHGLGEEEEEETMIPDQASEVPRYARSSLQLLEHVLEEDLRGMELDDGL